MKIESLRKKRIFRTWRDVVENAFLYQLKFMQISTGLPGIETKHELCSHCTGGLESILCEALGNEALEYQNKCTLTARQRFRTKY